MSMSRSEREAFLADVHVGVLSVARPSSGPLVVPIWYTYTPGGSLSFTTQRTSRKAVLISEAGRFSLCAQTEAAPYKYVSVEGPVTSVEDRVDPDERRALAYRYLGPEFGDLYLAATEADTATSCVIRMSPESWLSVDFAKQYG